MPKDITGANFEGEVLKSSELVLVDFWAPWCAPCIRMAPILEELEEAFAGKLKVGKLNVDEEPALAQQYQVMSIPNLLLFKEGQVVENIIGLTPREEMERLLKRHISE